MIDQTTLRFWRNESAEAMQSALGEYCPAEFIELLDAYEALQAQMTLANALAECRNSFIEELLKRIPVTDKEAV